MVAKPINQKTGMAPSACRALVTAVSSYLKRTFKKTPIIYPMCLGWLAWPMPHSLPLSGSQPQGVLDGSEANSFVRPRGREREKRKQGMCETRGGGYDCNYISN